MTGRVLTAMDALAPYRVVSAEQLVRLSALVVEDNGYMRDVIRTLLYNLGIGTVVTAKNGQDAVARLRDARETFETAGRMPVDFVVSDLKMTPINGLLLLQWLRGEDASPNRFMPFVMLSGAADQQYVESARDTGVTEFLAKPFSVRTVASRIAHVIDKPRQFVCSRNYLGPDRRRRRTDEDAPRNRRRPDERHVNVVYSENDIREAKGGGEAFYFRFPNALRAKAVDGTDEALIVPNAILKQAEVALARKRPAFVDWAGRYVRELRRLSRVAGATWPDERGPTITAINAIAHELRGQGGTFGYPLVTLFAKSLYEATLPGMPQTKQSIRLVDAHVDAIQAVFRDRIAGDGGPVGRELVDRFEEAQSRARTAG